MFHETDGDYECTKPWIIPHQRLKNNIPPYIFPPTRVLHSKAPLRQKLTSPFPSLPPQSSWEEDAMSPE